MAKKHRKARPLWLQHTLWFCFYALVRTMVMLFCFFPLSANLQTARVLGLMWYGPIYRLGRRRDRDRCAAHIRASFPDYSEEQVQACTRESMVHLVQVVFEMLFTPRLITPTTWQHYVRIEGLHAPLRMLLQAKPVIMCTGHYGSWELLGYTLACLGFDVHAVMRPLDNPYLNAWLEEVRARRGLRLLHKKGMSEQAHDLLSGSAGTSRVVAFIADQDAGRKGVFVPFFGRPASTYKSIALLAIEYDAAIVVGQARRIRRDACLYQMELTRVILPEEWKDQADPVGFITAEYTRAIEQGVRLDPAQYLWIHRRWKTAPPPGRSARIVA